MKYFVKRDVDGFFGLFVDNLVQLLMIIVLCSTQCGMTGNDSRFLYDLVLPGAALSILFGNLFYGIQAIQLARTTGRTDVTALPYGINTPSVIVYIFFVMAPEFNRTQSVDAAWRMGLLACLGSGIIEFTGAFFANWIRRNTPRAALLSTLAGIAVGFISMTFALQIFQKPLIAMVPLSLVLVGLFARVKLPLGIPSGFLAIIVGTAAAWLLTAVGQLVPGAPDWLTFGAMDSSAVTPSISVHLPVWCGSVLLTTIQATTDWLPLLSVVIPMGLFNVIGSLQNIESAEAAGDAYPATSSMVVNGLGTILAACFGSCFPTTIYIGHPGWKALGARSGYSTLNGLVIVAVTLLGLLKLISATVPIEAGAAIILWIGIIITAQAFQASGETYAPAVAMGLFPAIAAWGATVMLGTIMAAQGQNLYEFVTHANAPPSAITAELESAPRPTQAKTVLEVNGFLVHALLLMERGYIFTCMILAATSACLIDRKFTSAAVWMLVAAVFTGIGLMHAYQVYEVPIGPETNIGIFDYLFQFVPSKPGAYEYRAYDIAIGYLLSAVTFSLLGLWTKGQPVSEGHH